MYIPTAALAPIGLPAMNILRKSFLATLLACIILVNTIACHDHASGRHNGMSPPVVELAAILIGAAAEAGFLLLTRSHFSAALAAGTAGAGAKYLIEELGLSCKVCGTTSSYKKQTVSDCEPTLMGCSNTSCSRSAYLVASYSMDRLSSVLDQIEDNLQPTCLLTREATEGDAIKLIWYSHNSTSASLTGENVNPNGSMLVHPTQTTSYTLKVIGKHGRSEDSVTVEVLSADSTSGDDDLPDEAPPGPPLQPPYPTQLTIKQTPLTVSINRVVVHEDGSIGGTDWSFNLYLGNTNLMLLPKRSYHDDDKRVVNLNGVSASGIVQGDNILIRVSGHNIDDNETAEGDLTIPLDSFSSAMEASLEVTVRRNYKKGNFVFYLTIMK